MCIRAIHVKFAVVATSFCPPAKQEPEVLRFRLIPHVLSQVANVFDFVIIIIAQSFASGPPKWEWENERTNAHTETERKNSHINCAIDAKSMRRNGISNITACASDRVLPRDAELYSIFREMFLRERTSNSRRDNVPVDVQQRRWHFLCMCVSEFACCCTRCDLCEESAVVLLLLLHDVRLFASLQFIRIRIRIIILYLLSRRFALSFAYPLRVLYSPSLSPPLVFADA